MRILIASNCYPPNFIGGAELVAHRHARHLREMGHEVRVFAGDHSAPVARHHSWEDNYDGIEVTRVRLTGEDTQPLYANFLNRPVARLFNSILHHWMPDVVHFHNTTGLSLIAFHHCHRARVPVVVTLHDHWGFCLRNTLVNVRQASCLDFTSCKKCQPMLQDQDGQLIPISCRTDYMRRRFSTVQGFVTPSAYLANQYVRAGFDAEKFDVISNGIDPALPATPRPSGSPCQLTTICHLGQHKGVHVIFEALRRLPRTLNWRLNVVGTGPLESALRRLARNEGFAARVTFWGRVPNEKISEVFAETDVYLLASLWAENEPVSILESFAHGVPVIASDTGGVPELVRPGVNGWLVPVGDDLAMSVALTTAIKNPELVRQYSSAATRTGTLWPQSRQVARLVATFEKVRTVGVFQIFSRPLVAVAGRSISSSAALAISKFKEIQTACDVIPLDWLEVDEYESISLLLEGDEADTSQIASTIPRMRTNESGETGWLAQAGNSICAVSPTRGNFVSPSFVKN